MTSFLSRQLLLQFQLNSTVPTRPLRNHPTQRQLLPIVRQHLPIVRRPLSPHTQLLSFQRTSPSLTVRQNLNLSPILHQCTQLLPPSPTVSQPLRTVHQPRHIAHQPLRIVRQRQLTIPLQHCTVLQHPPTSPQWWPTVLPSRSPTRHRRPQLRQQQLLHLQRMKSPESPTTLRQRSPPTGRPFSR